MKEYLVIASIAYLISTHKISYKFRMWVWNLLAKPIAYKQPPDYNIKNKFYYFVYELITCPFCLGFWVGLITTLFKFKSVGVSLQTALCAAIISTILVKLT